MRRALLAIAALVALVARGRAQGDGLRNIGEGE
jgi:hypothetical protein